MENELTVYEHPANTVTILDLSGNITINGGSEILRDSIIRLFRNGSLNILLNLRDTEFVDSAGVELLVATRHQLDQAGRSLLLCDIERVSNCDGTLATALRAAGLRQGYDIAESEQHGLELFQLWRNAVAA